MKISFAYNRNPIGPLGFREVPGWERKKFKQASDMTKYFGPELFFGLELYKAYPNEKFLFIKRTLGGTSLYGCWNPNWSVEKATVKKEDKKPKLYFDFIEYSKEVLTSYDASELNLCGMIWVQGESDHKPDIAFNSYGANLTELIKGVRGHFLTDDLPFMCLEIGRLKNEMKKIEVLGHYNYEGMKRIGTNFFNEYASKYLTQ